MMGLHPEVRAALKARKERLAAETKQPQQAGSKPLPPAFAAALEGVRRRKGIGVTENADVAPDAQQSLPGPPDVADVDQGMETTPDAAQATSVSKQTEYRESSYLPTPEQIREACLAIQATWSEWERRARAGVMATAWTVPIGREVQPC